MYQLTCNSSDQQYIGSTTRFIHDRPPEHINIEKSSVKNKRKNKIEQNKTKQQKKYYKGIKVKIFISENDPANLHLYKAFYIRKCEPTLNYRELCIEFADLLF